tara:strand:- start:1232 stop:2446 length:1215 start_codon:yes stop_codon:yes gene_type:complete
MKPVDPRAIYEEQDVFGFVNGGAPLMPKRNSGSQGYTFQPDDPREQIVIDEAFQVGPNQEVVFENQIVWVRPDQRKDIQVYGKLTIRDSLLLWDQTEHQQTRLRIKNGGELNIKDSYSFANNQYWVNWDFESRAKVHFDNSVGDPWTSAAGALEYTALNYSTVKMTFPGEMRDATVRVTAAHHVWFEIFPPAGRHQITFPVKRQWVDWGMDIWPNTTVDVSDSYLYERDASISDDTHITVFDTPSGFSLGWAIGRNDSGSAGCVLSGLGDPENDSGVFYEEKVWDLPCNNSSLTVRDSVLQRAWPVTWGQVKLVLRDSNLVDPRVFQGPATMEIYDSTIDHIAAYQEGRVYLENSQVRYDIEVKDAESMIYGYQVSKRDEGREIEIKELDGGAYTALESPGPPW